MFSSMRGQTPQAEVRIDPEDGQPRTLEELKHLCAGRYSDAEVEEYWNEKCVPHEGEGIVNIRNDPFLTHAQRVPRDTTSPASQPASQAQAPPTATTPPPDEGRSADVGSDPFMTNVNQMAGAGSLPGAFSDSSLRARRQSELSAAIKHWTESLYRFLGPGDPDREADKVNAHIFGPWVVFVWVLLLWVLLRHYTLHVAVVLTLGLCICFAGMIFVWSQGVHGGRVPFLPLGVLCLYATLSGLGIGLMGWNTYWRQYWWMQTGFHTGATSGATPAGARKDFAVVDFWDSASGSTVNGTRVDQTKAAGYKDEHYYCVAPILSPEQAGVSLVLVNYWAVGLDCCQQLGSFTCDDAREYDGAYGVTMVEAGLPCPGCNSEQFKSAVAKAEAMHGLVSASDAVFVRWVKNPRRVQLFLLCRALIFIVVVSILSLGVFGALGWLSWYYGVGKLPPGFDVIQDPALAYQKQVD